MMDALIQVDNIRKVYGMGEIQVAALDGVSLEIKTGEYVAIMGPSGSGKSTLMNLLGCLDRPTEGRYILHGEDVSELKKPQLAAIRNREIGFIFQSYNLLARTSALENVMLPLMYSKGNGSIDGREERAKESLIAVGLEDRMEHQPQELSGGQQQRVAIARALVNDPALILADEPTGNLDSRSGAEIMGLLDDLNASGRTIIMVTHDPETAAHTERTIYLLDGKIDQIQKNGSEKVHDETI
ncbi:MAG: ABC transporter ATP-binding protein [Anaerolineales bacterium]